MTPARPIRRIFAPDTVTAAGGPGTPRVYLTFDDGPSPSGTARVLKVLRETGTPATFFLVAERARRQADLLREILADGHGIGNHSLDHGYRAFFGGRRRMRDWIAASESALRDLSGTPTVGFRPPAGVQTPELHRALGELRMPLILWDLRFFDAVFRFTADRARRGVGKLRAGSVVLLHDAQTEARQAEFAASLGQFIAGARAKGFEFRPILGQDLAERA